MADETELEPGAAPGNPESGDLDTAAVERREMLRRFGKFAAFTAPAMTVLMASRQGRPAASSATRRTMVGGAAAIKAAVAVAVAAAAASPADVWVSCAEVLAAGTPSRPSFSGTPLPTEGDGRD
jgi:hypothetical protein